MRKKAVVIRTPKTWSQELEIRSYRNKTRRVSNTPKPCCGELCKQKKVSE